MAEPPNSLGWHAPERDNMTSKPIADLFKFPSGIKSLADKVHDLGLKVSPFWCHSNSWLMTSCRSAFIPTQEAALVAEDLAAWAMKRLMLRHMLNGA
jgi:hypothetical protein